MHWTEKAVLKKDSAHLSLPVIQVLSSQKPSILTLILTVNTL